MVVTATRVNQPLSEAASSITVVSEKEIAQTQPLTFAEILDTIPNVDTTSSTSVMYNRVSIRGSQPNQITYLIDGMRQDDLTMGGNRPMGVFADPEILKQVEVRNGGGSALYGNGGIGGTLALETKSAADFLADSDKDFGALVKVGYGSDSISWSKSAYAFGRSDMWDVVAGVTRRDSERVSAVGAAIFGVRPFAAEGRSPWGEGRPALAGREGSRRGGTPLRRARSRAQGAALVKNKVYKYWFKSRLKDRLAVAEKRAETLANAGFSACGQPLKCQ